MVINPLKYFSGYEISIKNLVKKISRLMGKKTKVRSKKERIRPTNSEVKRLCAHNLKAKKLIGWEPKYSKTIRVKAAQRSIGTLCM